MPKISFFNFLESYLFIKFFFLNQKLSFKKYSLFLKIFNNLKVLFFNNLCTYKKNNFYLNYFFYLSTKAKYYNISVNNLVFFKKKKYFLKKYYNYDYEIYSSSLRKINFLTSIKKRIIIKKKKKTLTHFNIKFLLMKKRLFLKFFKSNLVKKYEVVSYFTSKFVKTNLVNISFLFNYKVLSFKKLFIFTTSFLNFGLNYLNFYLTNLFFYKVLFFNNNYWKWLYFYIKLNKIKKGLKKVINFNRYLTSNIVFPFYLDSYKHKSLINILNKKYFNNFSSNFNLLFMTFFKKFFFKNTILVLKSYSISLSSYRARRSLFLLFKTSELINLRYGYKSEFFTVVCFTYESGDPKILLRWICKSLVEINYRKYLTFLVNVRDILQKAFDLSLFSNFNGICIIIKGKLGSVGSVRKKVFYIKIGSFSQSKFYSYGDELYSYARTKTGKIGVKIITNYY